MNSRCDCMEDWLTIYVLKDAQYDYWDAGTGCGKAVMVPSTLKPSIVLKKEGITFSKRLFYIVEGHDQIPQQLSLAEAFLKANGREQILIEVETHLPTRYVICTCDKFEAARRKVGVNVCHDFLWSVS